jgi:hypothetical protein
MSTAWVFWTAKIAITTENASARTTITWDTRLGGHLGCRPGRAPRRRSIARQFLRLPLVWRAWVVDTAQNTSVHQMS